LAAYHGTASVRHRGWAPRVLNAMYALALAASLPSLLATATPRELVYSYTVERSQTDQGDTAHGVDKMDPGGGGTFYFHNNSRDYRPPPAGGGEQRRSGKIVIDVVREQSGGGLVLHVTEDAAAGGPVTCVAFGDTTVVCDPNREILPEVPALAALLGAGFVDPSRLDNARHWHIEPTTGYGTTADYTIVGKTGSLLEIKENATRTEANSAAKTTIAAAIQYDMARSLPTSFQQSSVETDHRGSVNETISTQTTLKLESAPGG
jgi:hypothetical protein